MTLHNDIGVTDRNGNRAPPIALDVAVLPSSSAGLEPKRTIEPYGADGRHMGAAVLVDRREPRRASVMCFWSGRRTRIQFLDDLRPVDWRQPVRRTQIYGFHAAVLSKFPATHTFGYLSERGGFHPRGDADAAYGITPRPPRSRHSELRRLDVEAGPIAASQATQYWPLITKYEPRMVPASFDFWRANLNESNSAGMSIPSESLNPTARFGFSPSSVYRTLIESPLS